MEELKSCPWCGHKPMRIVRTTHFSKAYGSRKDTIAFGCVNKNCPVKPRMDANDETIASVVDIFNTRAKE